MAQRKRKRYRLKKTPIFFLISLGIFVFVIGKFVVAPIVDAQSQTPEGGDSQSSISDLSASGDGSGQDIVLKEGDHFLEKQPEEVHRGGLILVNNKTKYDFSVEPNLVSVYDIKTGDYKVKDTLVSLDESVAEPLNQLMGAFRSATGYNDVMIISGHRTTEKQQALYDQEVAEKGAAEASMWVSLPGGSEHHTGYALDLGIFKTDGSSQSYTGEGVYQWINDNCYKYGFILRYETDKSEITGISYEPWHFRYLGKAHAAQVVKEGLCYEEYIDYLKEFTYESPLSITDADGKQYEAYFVKAASSGTTKVPVPSESGYDVSGNNVDGFIVTVEK